MDVAIHTKKTINIISLCSGVGGLDLGVHRALRRLGYNPRTVCYVEGELFSASTLVKAMEAAEMDEAPIWSNVKTFESKPFVESMGVDCVIGGFPCQPFSIAGKRTGKDHKKHLWPDVFRVLKESGARYAFFENVPGLVRAGLREVIEDLSSIGFNAEWDMFSASEEGAIHQRSRVFIFAYANSSKLWNESERMPRRWAEGIQREGEDEFSHNGAEESYPNSHGKRLEGGRITRRPCEEQPESALRSRPWEAIKPGICRGSHGIPDCVDRIRALGNAVVPATSERAFMELFHRAMKRDL